LASDPKVVKASSVIARLMDDMVSHKVLFYFCIIIIVNS
jgi:hypothetical protein